MAVPTQRQERVTVDSSAVVIVSQQGEVYVIPDSALHVFRRRDLEEKSVIQAFVGLHGQGLTTALHVEGYIIFDGVSLPPGPSGPVRRRGGPRH